MIRLCAAFIGALLLFNACGGQAGTQRLERQVPVLAVERISTSGLEVSFDIRMETPTPCYTLSRCDFQWQNSSCTVTVFADADPDQPCIQMISVLDTSITTKVDQSGEYSFRFAGSGEETIEQVVVVEGGRQE